jgi:hypothetical protein
MKDLLIRVIILFIATISTKFAKGQDYIPPPVKWGFVIQPLGNDLYHVETVAMIKEGYFIYSRTTPLTYIDIATVIQVEILVNNIEVKGGFSEKGKRIKKGDLIIFKDSYATTMNIMSANKNASIKWKVTWTECGEDGKCERKSQTFESPLNPQK